MFLFSLIWAAIKAVFGVIALGFKILYHVLRLLRIRLLFLYLVVCGLLQLIFQLFTGYAAIIFWLGLGACVMLTLFAWGLHFYAAAKRKYVRRERREEKRRERRRRRRERQKRNEETLPAAQIYPQYFGVEGKPDYMFAEYEDRYELFCRDGGEWKYVKTDYKRNELA